MTAIHTDAPARPWVRDDVPLVWRSDSSVDIGYPPHTRRLDRVDRNEITWLMSLRGDRCLEDALTDGIQRGMRRTRLTHLVRLGISTGLIDDAGAIPETLRQASIRVRDGLSGDLAAIRHIHGGTAHARDVIDRRRRSEISIRGEGTLAEAVCLSLTSSGVGNILRAGSAHSSSRRHRRAALERACQVLCDAPHPDAASDAEAMALDVPHISVTALGPQAVIGPLVIPGRTSCLRCRDLHQADADPAWPRLAAQWAHRRTRHPAIATGLAQVAGGWAALQVLALIDAGVDHVDAPAIEGALIITLPSAQVRHEARPTHPLCGCAWPSTGTGNGNATGRRQQPSISPR